MEPVPLPGGTTAPAAAGKQRRGQQQQQPDRGPPADYAPRPGGVLYNQGLYEQQMGAGFEGAHLEIYNAQQGEFFEGTASIQNQQMQHMHAQQQMHPAAMHQQQQQLQNAQAMYHEQMQQNAQAQHQAQAQMQQQMHPMMHHQHLQNLQHQQQQLQEMQRQNMHAIIYQCAGWVLHTWASGR